MAAGEFERNRLRRIDSLDSKTTFWRFVFSGWSKMMTARMLIVGNLKKMFSSKDVMTINDYRMWVDPSKEGIHRELAVFGRREPISTQFVKDQVHSGDTVIEVGANIGYYAILESKKNINGKIFAIEPVPSNRSELIANLDLNDCKNVSIFPFAISDRAYKSVVYIPEECNWSSLLPPKSEEPCKTVDVDVITLDEFVNKYVQELPNFIRMDVEGAECKIILGALETLRRCERLCLFIELHPHLAPEEEMTTLLLTLQSLGFKVLAIINEPPLHMTNNIEFSSWLSTKTRTTGIGFLGNDYETLQRLLTRKVSLEVFFCKNNGSSVESPDPPAKSCHRVHR